MAPERIDEFDAALELARHDLGAAQRVVRRLRRSALRLGDSRRSIACLVALRIFASMAGNRVEERRLIAKLAAERGEWLDIYLLAQVWERDGNLAKARTLYEQALRICPDADPDRDLVARALARLSLGAAPSRRRLS